MKLLALGALTLSFLFLLGGCPSPSSSPPPPAIPTSSVSLAMNNTLSAEVNSAAPPLSSVQKVNINLDLGTSAHKVYFVFTNESTAPTGSMPQVQGDVASEAAVKSVASPAATQGPSAALPARGVNVGAPPEILAANQDILGKLRVPSARALSSNAPSFNSAPTTVNPSGPTTIDYLPPGYTLGGSIAAIPCTLQYVVDQSAGAAQRKLFVWVDNNCFDGSATSGYTYTKQTSASPIPFKVNASQVKAIGDAFLNSSGNDIYDYDTAIYGKEYPDLGAASPGTGLITPQGEIHIFIVDLNPTSTHKGNGGALGYFYGGDNIQAGFGYADTNQKIMFQLDAEMLGNPNPDGSLSGLSVGTAQTKPLWSLTGSFWPNEMLSTLAHEFQHMIHFYQKQVKNNLSSGTVTWVNEMASMVTEDFVAKKIGTLGPRGTQFNANGSFSYVDGTGVLYSGAANSAYNDPGSRLAFFNYYYPTVGLQTWGDVTTGNLANYGVAYAFGAWLARNYGGPELFHSIVANANTDETAVTAAVNSLNATNLTMPQLLEQWAAAMLMGPHGNGAAPYSLISTNSSFLYTPASVNYGTGTPQSFTYGSIDPTKYYSYDYTNNILNSPAGPRVFTTTSGVAAIPARAFYYYTPNGGAVVSGTKSYTVTLPANVQLQVVTVPSP